jgi:hypothetical protein
MKTCSQQTPEYSSLVHRLYTGNPAYAKRGLTEMIRGLTSSPGIGLIHAAKTRLAAYPGPPDNNWHFRQQSGGVLK